MFETLKGDEDLLFGERDSQRRGLGLRESQAMDIAKIQMISLDGVLVKEILEVVHCYSSDIFMTMNHLSIILQSQDFIPVSIRFGLAKEEPGVAIT